MSTWTRFMDMHSGGGTKEQPYDKILIEAPEAEAKVIFYNRFGHNPERVSCTCCGDDYSISESATLEEATSFDRNCHSAYFYLDDNTLACKPGRWVKVGAYDHARKAWMHDGREIEFRYVEQGDKSGHSKYLTLDEYLARPDVLLIRSSEITADERVNQVPTEGWVWA